MHLQNNEIVLKIFHHHPLPFVFRAIKIVASSLPFYFVAFLFSGLFSPETQIAIYSGISLLFGAVCFYDLSIFYLDRIIITNKRVIHIDWVNFFTNHEIEALLDDIQDIQTTEKGFLSRLKIFDYGNFRLETSSTQTTIAFPEANDPEGIKHFIYNTTKKHFSLHAGHNSGPSHDLDTQKSNHLLDEHSTIEKDKKEVESQSIL